MTCETDGRGGYTYVCTRSDMANLPSPKPVRYRCKRCGRVDRHYGRARWHRWWRWLTDLPAAPTPTNRREEQ